MRIEISKEQRDALAAIPAPFAEEIVTAYDQSVRDMVEKETEIALARGLYATGEIEIDAEPAVSIAEDGVWVEAWVWVEDD